MNLQLESPVLDRLEISRSDLLVDMAVGLYMDRRVTLGQASDIADMPQSEFRCLLGRLGVSVQYDLDDFEHDLAVLRERGVK
jgi:predicted HTH domain antitoxin